MPDARPSFEGWSGRAGARGAGEREQLSAGAGDLYPNSGHSIYQTLSRVKSGGGAAYLLSVTDPIACKDTSLLEAFSCLCPPPTTCYKLL